MDTWTARWTPQTQWTQPLPDWDGPGTLVLVFGDSSLLSDDAPLRALVAAFPRSTTVGCSTSGQILDTRVHDGALTVTVVRFERTRIALESAPVTVAASAEVGRSLGARLRARAADFAETDDGGLAAVFVLSDGLSVNGSALAAGLADGTGGSAVITGGLAGDDSRFERTWVVVDGQPRESHVTAVGLYGSALDVGYASRGGWTSLGPERVVTRSEGNVLYELDDQPALALYKTYLGERATGLPATALLFPLLVRIPRAARAGGPAPGGDGASADDSELVRTVLAVDEARQSMTFAGDVPEGSSAQLMRGTAERLVDAAEAAASSARLPGDGPGVAIAVSCVGRRLYLGQRVEDELEAVCAGLGPHTPLVGFYSYGELSPVVAGGCDLHNQTMTITVLRERPR